MGVLKRAVSISLALSVINLNAEVYTRGLYGKLEYVFMQDSIKDSYNETKRKSIVQNYELGYESFIYSPYLLVYDISGGWLIDDSTTDISGESGDYSTNRNVETTNYRAYLHFIKYSKYPFTVYKEKIDNPIWTTEPNRAALTTYKTDSQGITGRIKSDIVKVGYEIRDYKIDRTESFAVENQKKRRYALTLSKEFDENLTAYLSASHENRDYYRNDWGIGYTDIWSDTYDSVTGNVSWKIDPANMMTFFSSYMKNSYLEYQDTMATITYSYFPGTKFRANLSVTADSMETAEGTNNYLTLSGNSSYQIQENWSTNQVLTLYNASGDTIDMSMATLTLGTNYTKEHSETLTSNYNASVTASSEKYGNDTNLTLTDRTLLSYTLGAGAVKNFPESHSSVNAGVTFYQLISSANDSSKRASLYGGYNKRFLQNLSYRLKASLLRDEAAYYDATLDSTTTRSTNIIDVDNMINYWRNVNSKGKLNLTAGAKYTSGIFKTRFNPYANAEFTYMLRRALILKAIGRVSSDTAYGTTTYTGNLEMVYSIRKVRISVGSYYSSQTGGSPGQKTHTNIYFRIIRRL